jgi:hypothetical protein
MHLKRMGLPHLGTDGVGFAMMRDDGVRQQCLVERDALALLAGRNLMSGEMSEAFERHRDGHRSRRNPQIRDRVARGTPRRHRKERRAGSSGSVTQRNTGTFHLGPH